MGQREPDFAEQLALSAYVENRVGEKLDYIAPVEEELVLRLRCAVVVEGERLGVEDTALTENLGADIAAYLVGVVVEVDLGTDMNDLAVRYPVNCQIVLCGYRYRVLLVVNGDVCYRRLNKVGRCVPLAVLVCYIIAYFLAELFELGGVLYISASREERALLHAFLEVIYRVRGHEHYRPAVVHGGEAMCVGACKSKDIAPGGYDLLEQDIPELAVVAGAVVALGVDIDAEAGGVHFEQAGELIYVVVVVFVISLVEILFVARARVFAGVVDDRKTAELFDILYRSLVVARAAQNAVAVVNEPGVDMRVVERSRVVLDAVGDAEHSAAASVAAGGYLIVAPLSQSRRLLEAVLASESERELERGNIVRLCPASVNGAVIGYRENVIAH